MSASGYWCTMGIVANVLLDVRSVFLLAPSSLRLVPGTPDQIRSVRCFSFDVPGSPPAMFLRFSHRKADTREEND